MINELYLEDLEDVLADIYVKNYLRKVLEEGKGLVFYINGIKEGLR